MIEYEKRPAPGSEEKIKLLQKRAQEDGYDVSKRSLFEEDDLSVETMSDEVNIAPRTPSTSRMERQDNERKATD